jgi:DNA-directed RNA polymerase sigma subunit (sigma70/sigma32)
VAERLGDWSSLAQIYGGAHGLEWVEEYLEMVPEPERSVLMLRFGLHGSEPLEAAAVASSLGLTRQGVARLERSGLSKLRSWIGAGRKPNQVAA